MTRDNALAKRLGKIFDGYLLDSVRKGGAGGCGLSPSLPMAWQREQFSRTSSSPLPTRPFSTGAAGLKGTSRNDRKTTGAIVLCIVPSFAKAWRTVPGLQADYL
jgi:hypothetical protein